MVRIRFHTAAQGLIPGRGTEILHAAWHGQKQMLSAGFQMSCINTLIFF